MSRFVPDLFLKIDTLFAYSLDQKVGTDVALRKLWGLRLSAADWTRYRFGERGVDDAVLRDILTGALGRLPKAAAGLAADSGGEPLCLSFPSFWRALDEAVRPGFTAEQMRLARARTRDLLWALLVGEGQPALYGQGAAAVDIRGPENAERWVGLDTGRVGQERLPAGGSFTLIIPTAAAGSHRLWLYELRNPGDRLLEEGPAAVGDFLQWISSPRLADAQAGANGPTISLPAFKVGPERGQFILRAIALPAEIPASFDLEGCRAGPRKLDFAATALAMQKLRKAVEAGLRRPSTAPPYAIAHFHYFVS